jgi:glycosyltransferase involved in cell wall biosynthesis
MSSLIVHTEASDAWGGQERRILGEMKAFRARGYECVILAPARAELFKRATTEGFECINIEFSKKGQFFDFWRVKSFFHKRKPLMVGTHSSVDSWVALLAAWASGVKVRIRYRHVSVPVKNNVFNKILYKHAANFIVTTAESISEALFLSLGVSKNNIQTIPTGIELPKDLIDRETVRKNLCAELKLSEDSRFIGMIAVMRLWKGYDDLIKAFDRVSEKFPKHHLVLIGEGTSMDYYKSVAAAAKNGARVHFLGYRENVYDYFRAFDVAALCSTKNEGIPQSLLQAMFCETPVIGTRIGGIPEIVIDGETGLLAPACDDVKLAEVLEKTLSDENAAKLRAQKAFENVSKNNTVEAMTSKVEAIIKRIGS